MRNAIETALGNFAPVIAERYAEMVRNTYESIRLTRPNGIGPSIYNDPKFARVFRLVIAPVLVEAGINEAKLAAAASSYASDVIAAWVAKTTEKVGKLEGAEVQRMSLDGDAFIITGTRNGKQVRIEQTTIFKVSPKGLPFNQFPARIYVDGKFVSEAQYKKAA